VCADGKMGYSVRAILFEIHSPFLIFFAVLHISFKDLVHTSLVLDNVSIQLGASSSIAAAHAIHEKGNISGTLLYALASQSSEVTWDVGDLQVDLPE
jgi:hypothetical protein